MLFLDVIQSTWDDSIMEHYISDKLLESLLGNRVIQDHFVNQHLEHWGDSIDRMGHPMSGILLGEGLVQPDSEGFLPQGNVVQVCHGQHRKLVMVEKVKSTLITQHTIQTGEELDNNYEL